MPVTTALAHKALKTVEVTRDNIMQWVKEGSW